MYLCRAALSQQGIERVGRWNACMLQPFDLAAHGAVLFRDSPQRLVAHKAQLVADGGQALVGIVLPQDEAVFTAARHDAVGLVRALGHKVVNERADIGLLAAQNERRLALDLPRGVHARDKALHRRLLVARRAVELSRTVQTPDMLILKRRIKGGRVDAVIFDGVGRAHDLRVLKPLDRVQHCKLHLLGHG